MTINKSRGNMYKDKDTWNGMYGICDHNCLYCYNRLHWNKWGKMRLNEKALKDNLGSGRNIFVGSSCDMFAENIPDEWIRKVLVHCNMFDNNYLFQTKNPVRFQHYIRDGLFPKKTILGTTIETDTDYGNKYTNAPSVTDRRYWLMAVSSFDTMVSIEPIMDFNLGTLVYMIESVKPKYVSIGANTSFRIKLPEPSWDKVQELIKELKKFTEVKVKDNLERLRK